MQIGSVDIVLTATNQPILISNNPLVFTKVLACNTDTVNRTLTLYRVAAGGSPGLPIIDGSGANAFTVGAGETKVVPFSGGVLTMAASIQGFASVTGVVNLSLSYTVPDLT